MLMAKERAQWGSRLGFILAAAGSAVGLGNIWKFPYITGQNGGGLFVLIYLGCILLVGLPIMMAEIMIGRSSQRQPVGAFKKLESSSSGWTIVGWFGVIAGFLILSFYIVVAGWAMDYTLKSVVNFTQPIYEKAEADSLDYRAHVSADEMRSHLIDQRANESIAEHEENLQVTMSPRTWQAYQSIEQALANGAFGTRPLDSNDLASWKQSRQGALDAVLSDETLGQLWSTETFNEFGDDLEYRNEANTEATQFYAPMSDEEVKTLATEQHRRDAISTSVTTVFLELLKDGWTDSFWAAIFMLLTILIVSNGVSAGIERACKVLMPLLVFLICVMVVYGFFQRGFEEAVSFVFKPDASRLKPSGVLEALGHAFFTLSLGMGAMITYGSYQKSKKSLLGQSFAIAGIDTLIALLACMMMFPIIFSYDQEPGAGPGLVFMSMPLAFAEMGQGGLILGIIFFALLVFAALTSAISLLEVVSSYFIDERNWSRRKAAWLLGGIIFAFGVIAAFANSPGFKLASWEPGYGQNFFDTLDYLTSNWMLPLGGLFIAIYAGWFMPRKLRMAEMEDMAGGLVMLWFLLIRFVAPALVIVVLLQKIGFIDADEFFYAIGF